MSGIYGFAGDLSARRAAGVFKKMAGVASYVPSASNTIWMAEDGALGLGACSLPGSVETEVLAEDAGVGVACVVDGVVCDRLNTSETGWRADGATLLLRRYLESGMIVCPDCGHENIPGSDQCEQCQQPLTPLSDPAPATPIERAIAKDRIEVLKPKDPLAVRGHAVVVIAAQ